jgi:hypothetical protein
MRVTLKTIHEKLKRLGHDVRVERGDGYFYVWGPDVNGWLDRTIKVPTLSRLTLDQWVEEFNRLKKLNEELSARSTKSKGHRLGEAKPRSREAAGPA